MSDEEAFLSKLVDDSLTLITVFKKKAVESLMKDIVFDGDGFMSYRHFDQWVALEGGEAIGGNVPHTFVERWSLRSL